MRAKTFGNEMRKIRESKGITLRQLSKKIDCSPTYISDIELGHRKPPTHEMINRICKELSVTTDVLHSLKIVESGELRLSVDNLDTLAITLAACIASRWNSMSYDETKRIISLLSEDK